MSTTVVIKIRNGQVHDIITNGLDVNVIIADYDTFTANTDQHGEPCNITRDAAAEDPKEVYEFEEILERRRTAMNIHRRLVAALEKEDAVFLYGEGETRIIPTTIKDIPNDED